MLQLVATLSIFLHCLLDREIMHVGNIPSEAVETFDDNRTQVPATLVATLIEGLKSASIMTIKSEVRWASDRGDITAC